MYGFNVVLHSAFDTVLANVAEVLKKEGFGILTEIKAEAVLKEKLGLEMRPYRILGACNPLFAHRAISKEPDIGLLLPCNVLVREEEDGSVNVGFMDPGAVLGLVQRPELEEIAGEVRKRLMRARDNLQKME